MPLNNIQKAKELKNNANLLVRRADELDKAINKRESLQREFERRIKHLDNKIETLSNNIEEVKHPTAKAIGLPRLMLPIGEVWFSLCVPNHRDFTEFDLQRIPYRSHTSYFQRRNFAYFLR